MLKEEVIVRVLPVFLFSFLIGIFQPGCSTNRGPKMIPVQRFDYNQQASRSQNEQMLLNLVRLRYSETPLFLELNNIVTQYDIQNQATLASKLTLTNEADSKASANTEPSLSAGLSFTEKPTISYTPLQGEDFARQILTPIPPETLVLLSQSGWSISRLFLLCVQRMNGVENAAAATGPTPDYKPKYEKFHELVKGFRALQKAGLLGVETSQEEGKTMTRILFLDPGSERGALKDAQANVRKTLGLDPGKSQYRLAPSLFKGGGDEIGLSTRSLLGVLFFLSQSVEPPQEHQEGELVTVTRDEAGNVFDWSSLLGSLMKIHSSKDRPKNAFVRVFYRDHWFFIEDSDRNSKATFSLLNYLFALQSAEGKGVSPLLTLTA